MICKIQTDLFSSALQYKKWADQRSIDAALSMDQNVFSKELRFIRQQLNHIIIVEDNFKARLCSLPEPHAHNNTDLLPSLGDLAARFALSNDWYAFYAQKMAHDQVISFNFVDGKHGKMSVIEILFHVVNHATYHRGAIGRALEVAGLRPADTFTMWVHEAEPERRLFAL